MPDLIYEVFYHCKTAEHYSKSVFSSTGKEYHVLYGPSHGQYQFDWTCDCSAFKFGRGKYCKHIEQVKSSPEYCGWMQFQEGGEVVRKDGEAFCPKCGERAIAQRHGV